MSSYTFLVTGASSGLGAHIALAALKAGHGVVATARNVAKAKASYPEIEHGGGTWLALDVTSPETQSIVKQAIKQHNVNVIVNNAGYAERGVLEDMTMEQIRAQMETNVFGFFAVTKGAIPTFRQHRNGTFVNISSTAGISGPAVYSAYAASKFALEGASEALADELADSGIRVLIVEPGAFRTGFQAAVKEMALSEAYVGTAADARRKAVAGGTEAGDPAKAGQAVVEAVTGIGRGKHVEGCMRLPLGKDAVQRARVKTKGFAENVEKVREISEWAVFDDA